MQQKTCLFKTHIKGHFGQGSKDQKHKDQVEGNWTLNWNSFHIWKKNFLRYNECVYMLGVSFKGTI
jgi:hypothetical protein